MSEYLQGSMQQGANSMISYGETTRPQSGSKVCIIFERGVVKKYLFSFKGISNAWNFNEYRPEFIQIGMD